MRLFSKALAITVLTAALLTPTAQSHYLASSASGSRNHGGDYDADGVQHISKMPTSPHGRHGEPDPVGWKPKKNVATNAALLMPSGLDDALMFPKGSPLGQDRKLRLRGN